MTETSLVDGTCGLRATMTTSKVRTAAATASVSSHTQVGTSIVPPLMIAGWRVEIVDKSYLPDRVDASGGLSHLSMAAAPGRQSRPC